MTGGQPIGSGLQAAIERCRGMLLIATPEAITKGWVRRQGAPVDLNTLIFGSSGLTLLLACSINDSGQIIGLAVDSNGDHHGYLATPGLAGKDNEDAAEASGPAELPQYVREQVRRQLHVGRFVVHPSTP